MKYRCLILDHDDTTVDSTATIHYPSFLNSMAVLRPEVSMSLEEYFQMNCDPGILSYYKNVVKLTEEELQWEHNQWITYAAAHTPKPFPGMKELMLEHKRNGGYICVVSHNLKENILRDYERNGLPAPDLIFGSDYPKEQQKPSIWPIEQIMEQLQLQKQDLLMVDDLLPGYEMAKNAGIAFAAACWAHEVPSVRKVFAENAVPCLFAPLDLIEIKPEI